MAPPSTAYLTLVPVPLGRPRNSGGRETLILSVMLSAKKQDIVFFRGDPGALLIRNEGAMGALAFVLYMYCFRGFRVTE